MIELVSQQRENCTILIPLNNNFYSINNFILKIPKVLFLIVLIILIASRNAATNIKFREKCTYMFLYTYSYVIDL